MINKRVISAAIALPILLFFVLRGGIAFTIGVLAITAIALYEYICVYKNTNHKVIFFPILIGYFLNAYSVIISNKNVIIPAILLVVITSMATPIFAKKYNVVSSALTITGYIYIVVFFSMLIYIIQAPNGSTLIWLVFIIAFGTDTFAYYSGRFFGRTKLCPEVSPKKTVEGSIGGILGSILGVSLWGYINPHINFHWYQLIMMGTVGSIISQIGDLSASLIKRYAGVKDYGNIMPGHGGILDRFDSILFTAPVVYYYIVLFLG
ncbi:phosphatidate cytidylyltransferase [Fonticella tunisiensis]|uniref:Phosphatidate cytidylyltransferase n=1 Tax=Fonticella tunisiensis TaxID=1096341 RepID=A0A4R7KRZ2_9CLOT|nr:phosphatidate cytidylyltransferase [Fonticella tunisiensis]TDT61577.1 phosphatidate cytidylyltransferase [Fonticella tunisiensis]